MLLPGFLNFLLWLLSHYLIFLIKLSSYYSNLSALSAIDNLINIVLLLVSKMNGRSFYVVKLGLIDKTHALLNIFHFELKDKPVEI
jgi:hypothetical protein